jgi:hypothetical protein
MDQPCGLDSSGLGQGPIVNSSDYGNESLSSIEGREFLDYVNNH